MIVSNWTWARPARTAPEPVALVVQEAFEGCIASSISLGSRHERCVAGARTADPFCDRRTRRGLVASPPAHQSAP